MLFDSYIFIFCFLPVTLFGFYLLGKSQKYFLSLSWLVFASLFFYGWWDPKYLILLLISISVNYGLGKTLWTRASAGKNNQIPLFFGILFNLIFLGYFKYAYFFISNLNGVLLDPIAFDPIILPLGISFFTFQKIAFLVDASRGEIKAYKFIDYCLFVTFFPQLIAGPIVQHKQFIPQLEKPNALKMNSQTFSIGLTFFFMGLLKKIGLADGIAEYANAVFDGAATGIQLSFWEAWCGSFAYALQLYFDFSGYSDMAIGLAYLFGIKLPINFYSPYKATNIIDFWRRWHMTLSLFLRNYLYIPLGGNRKGSSKRYVNLMITMLLGGLWHGANWTFVVWGAMHGAYLMVNHFWRNLCENVGVFSLFKGRWFSVPARVLTLLAVVIAWVPFRADNIHVAISMFHSMLSFDYFALPNFLITKLGFVQQWLSNIGFINKGMFYNGLAKWQLGIIWIMGLLTIALALPNTTQMMARHFAPISGVEVKPSTKLTWQPSTRWAAVTAFIILMALMLLSDESEFLYFQF